MAGTHSLTLVEISLDKAGAVERLADDLDRVVYVARGDASLADPRLIQRLPAGTGGYCRGPLELAAEADDTLAWVWQLAAAGARERLPDTAEIKLRQEIELESSPRVMRLDKVDFPPGAAAHTHVHPGPGIRIVRNGRIGIRQGDSPMKWMAAGEPWFERGPDPVFAPTTEDESTTFIRCMILPTEWRGLNTIRYVDPADDDKPKLQRYHRFVDALIDLPEIAESR